MSAASTEKAALPTRLLLLCITVGAMAGAMLGAAAAYFYFNASALTPGGEPRAANPALRVELEALREELAQLRAVLPTDLKDEANNLAASAKIPREDSEAALGGAAADRNRAYLSGVANGVGQLAGTRFAEPDYDKAMQRLMAAGFTAYDAERIFMIEAEAHLRFIQSMHNPATRGQQTASDIVVDFGAALQNDLGDYGYENYLRSRDLPTDVEILDVSRSSAAANAGLQKGDRVLTYDGKRVFNIQELSRMVETRSGTTDVTVEIMRDGERQQIRIPVGKMGIRAKPLSPGTIFELRPVLNLP